MARLARIRLRQRRKFFLIANNTGKHHENKYQVDRASLQPANRISSLRLSILTRFRHISEMEKKVFTKTREKEREREAWNYDNSYSATQILFATHHIFQRLIATSSSKKKDI